MGWHAVNQGVNRVHTYGSVDLQLDWPTVRIESFRYDTQAKPSLYRFTWGIEMTCKTLCAYDKSN